MTNEMRGDGEEEAYDWVKEDLLDELDEDYLVELGRLQVELLKLQRYVMDKSLRLAIIFEGRDTAGKGGAIQRFVQRLRPRNVRIVALSKPTDTERGQWYFERYVKQLPDPGEIVLFDRSWYNRAVVEPVMGFCDEEQYERFMRHVVQFEQMLIEDGMLIVKLWFSIDREEQHRRIEGRRVNPLKEWKLSPVDLEAEQLWDKYTHYKQAMFDRTCMAKSPWVVIEGNGKRHARLESIRYVLNSVPYPDRGQDGLRLKPDPTKVSWASGCMP